MHVCVCVCACVRACVFVQAINQAHNVINIPNRTFKYATYLPGEPTLVFPSSALSLCYPQSPRQENNQLSTVNIFNVARFVGNLKCLHMLQIEPLLGFKECIQNNHNIF